MSVQNEMTFTENSVGMDTNNMNETQFKTSLGTIKMYVKPMAFIKTIICNK